MSFVYTKHADNLLFIPLGGTNEIGMNCSLYHYEGKWLMADLGIGFSGAMIPGVDVVIPDISFIKKYEKDLLGIIITHAHEDHLGAVQYLYHELSCPIYVNKFSSAVLQSKLKEFNINIGSDNRLREFTENSRFNIGPFDIEAVSLAHSVPEMSSLVIRTDQGIIYHTGDWKIDKDPVVGSKTNLDKLKELGDEGVTAIICDSTNIFKEGVSGSEGDLKASLTDIISGIKKGLVVVTTFASNIARLESIAKAAAANGRKVVLSGRSLWRMYYAALDSGYLADLPPFIEHTMVRHHNRDELLIIATGCQGEENATVAKVATETHKTISLHKNDTIIFSSKIIPGNEKRIFSILNKFAENGINVLTENDHFVHVSGHPSRDEVREVYSALRPKFSIPVHGESVHIREHASYAKTLPGVKDSVILNNGTAIIITSDEVFPVGNVKTGVFAVDGKYITEINSRIFAERKRMRDNGLIIVSLSLTDNTNKLKKPYIIGPGIIDSKTDGEFIELLQNAIIDKLKKGKISNVKGDILKLVRGHVQTEYGKDPLIEVLVERE